GAEIDLINARHPLLVMREDNLETIPLDLELGTNRQGIIITGPNTGGKTVALKTVGLLALMASAGIPIPADARSKVGIFANIFADIGDEQSIEQSLSTFSSHLTKVIEGVTHANSQTLLLYDEIGAGTDPKEGAALAEAIILDVIQRGAKLIATTHYTQLKTLPLSHPELENASMEFDKESLCPTFRLIMGLPGSSYATEIAGRLGMPARIVTSAREKLDEGERSLADLIESLGNELKQVRDDSAKLTERLSSASELELLYESKLDEFKKEVGKLKKQAAEEAEELLNAARKDIESAVKEIRQTQASKESIKKAQEKIESGLSRTIKLREEQTKPFISHNEPLKPGDTVWLRSLKKDGELIDLMGEKRARVRIGAIINIVDLDDLIKATTPAPHSRPNKTPAGLRVETDPAPEIHLRGMTVEEATEKLDKFLDSAMLAGLPQVYIIHGKGAGILRKALTKFLKDHPGVESVRLGDWNQGGVGVTVAKMK
ncbi:MAG: Smr/MutS family protein, partial [candidate division Zixibacteria bacterium]|nr:Smr/MutS family protein [candidate division Zixibacteria bacterium]